MATASVVSEEKDGIETHGTDESSAKRIRVEFDGTLAEEPDRVAVTESTAGVSSLPVLAHKSGMTPEMRIIEETECKITEFEYEIIDDDNPCAVAMDYQTRNIYVSVVRNDRLKVFDGKGEYLYAFGDRIADPCYITISENRVFVSQSNSNCVSVYDLNGTLITQFGNIGESRLFRPRGIAINEMNGDIYVCDSNNHRIQMFCKDLPLNSQFGQGILKSPRDIKITNEFIFVLSCHEPFLYSFAHDFTQTHNTTISSICKHLIFPRAFCIDASGHFIISDGRLNVIVTSVFNEQGELVRRISDRVSGVTLDSKGRILYMPLFELICFF